VTDTKNGLPVVHFDSQATWDAWLEENHEVSEGLWLKLAKKAAGAASVSYAEALDVALCFGWIDSQKASFDESFWLQRFTPRRPKSKWSKINVEKVGELVEQGRMRPAGLREVELARKDGRWEAAYASQSTMTVPEDFQARLDENPRAAAFFQGLNSANRYAILYRIHDAKRPATRAQRIEKFIALLEEGQTLY
jgi:uncharacterized protein YdeI (YjbR/CyaY-like superfamily)